jgi:alpha-L-rhamnosidase
VQSFFHKWLVDLADSQRADGQFPQVAPLKVAGGDGGPAWADAGTICPWDVWEVYGDRTLLARQYPSMVKFVEFCRGRSKPDLLPPDKFHCFGDWLNIQDPTPHEVIYTAYFAHSTTLVARSAKVLGNDADVQKYEKLAADVRAAFRKAYVEPDGQIKGHSQTAYVMALAFDLLDAEGSKRAQEHLIANLQKRKWHLSTGFVGTKDLMLVLDKIGRLDVAYRLLMNKTFPSWGFTIEHGATSIWERWDGWTPEKGFNDPGMNSFAHYAFGAVGQWLFERVAGIKAAQPGFGKALLAPRPGGGLTWVKARYDSPRGEYASDWRLDGSVWHWRVTIPPNASALVSVPAQKGSKITVNGEEQKTAEFELGSGSWSIECTEAAVIAPLK